MTKTASKSIETQAEDDSKRRVGGSAGRRSTGSRQAAVMASGLYQSLLQPFQTKDTDAEERAERRQQVEDDRAERKRRREQRREAAEKRRAERQVKKAAAALPVRRGTAERQGGATLYRPQRCDERVNASNPDWQGFRPYWLRDAERTVRIAPANFAHLRKDVHCMTVEQCAAFLRVETADVMRWEAGLEAIPYAAYAMLRMATELQYLPAGVKEWESFEFIRSGPDAGKLIDHRTGEMFSPAEITTIRYVYADAGRVMRENVALKRQLAALQAEAARLRSLRQLDGIAGELEAMQARMSALLDGINHGTELDINRATFARTLQEVTP